MSSLSGATRGRSPKLSSPVELLPTSLAATCTHIQPLLLLTVFYLRLPILIADPVSTLSWSLIPVVITQVAYCLLCLPVAGAKSTIAKKPQKARGPAVKKPSDGLLLSSSVSHVIVSFLLTTLAIPVLLAAHILLGAPLTTHLPHTILCSAHLAFLAIFPLIYVHGVAKPRWLEVLSVQSPLDEVFGAAVGACVGAWIGAVPIPLDWDREWQKWPVTVVTGLYGGYVAGKVVGGWLARGRRIEFD